jgi:hypothetical protein
MKTFILIPSIATVCLPLCTRTAAQDIRTSNGMVTDKSAQMLTIPASVYGNGPYDFDVAKEWPEVDFGILQVGAYGDGAPWGIWSESSLGPDGKFYVSAGNHKSYGGAKALIVCYDPVKKQHSVILNSQQVCGWRDDQFGDGKIHGKPDVGPGGDMWLLTFFGPYPSKSDWGRNYFGGHLIRYNIYTQETEHLGIPVADESWPLFTWDWARNRLYAVGESGMFQDPSSGDAAASYNPPAYNWDYGKVLVYDTKNRTVIRGTSLPATAGGEQLCWWRRSLLLDRSTGKLYGTECRDPHRFLCYDPATNAFTRMNASLQDVLNSWPDHVLGGSQDAKNSDGSIFCFDQSGNFYEFFPEQDRVENLGKNWPKGELIENIELSPGHAYLYFVPTSGWEQMGFPLVQYNVETGRKKVIAFLSDYYMNKYGFGARCTYNVRCSKDGALAYIACNGNFGNFDYGVLAHFCIHIPQSERSGDSAGIDTSSIPPPTDTTHTNLPPDTTHPADQSSYTGAPYNGAAHAVPGRIEAENYDRGGEGVAYHDLVAGNELGQYRTDDVDIEATTDPQGGGYQLGHTGNGEWINFSAEVQTAGSYTMSARVASGQAVQFHLLVDGVEAGPSVNVASTGSWTSWTTVGTSGIDLPAGKHVIRFCFTSLGFCLNWIAFDLDRATPASHIRPLHVQIPLLTWEYYTLKGARIGASKSGSAVAIAAAKTRTVAFRRTILSGQ